MYMTHDHKVNKDVYKAVAMFRLYNNVKMLRLPQSKNRKKNC